MTEARKAAALDDLQWVASRLRGAANSADAHRLMPKVWGPREVLAHIALWAVQATQHFACRLPPLNYGIGGHWGTEIAETFDAAFATLAAPGIGTEDASSQGWATLVREGVTLPLLVEETDELHERVDDAFNAAAAQLVKDLPFAVVLSKAEQAHSNLFRLLSDWPVTDYEPGNPNYERLLRIIAHHRLHLNQLEWRTGCSS
jgi:hypothetical protein